MTDKTKRILKRAAICAILAPIILFIILSPNLRPVIFVISLFLAIVIGLHIAVGEKK